MLDLAKIESGKMELHPVRTSVADLVERVSGAMMPIAERKNLDLSTDVDPELPLVFQDVGKLQQILNNLLSNAIKFTPEGGRITVTTREVSGAVNIYVEDNGIGIPKEALTKLGRPFEWVDLDAKKTTEGAGLGLAIARSFAELHGGTLTIRSTEGSGTTVLVRLPIRAGPPLEQAA